MKGKIIFKDSLSKTLYHFKHIESIYDFYTLRKTMPIKKIALQLSVIVLLISTLHANETTPKRALLANGKSVYTQLPKNINNFTEMFSEGKLYGRIDRKSVV